MQRCTHAHLLIYVIHVYVYAFIKYYMTNNLLKANFTGGTPKPVVGRTSCVNLFTASNSTIAQDGCEVHESFILVSPLT